MCLINQRALFIKLLFIMENLLGLNFKATRLFSIKRNGKEGFIYEAINPTPEVTEAIETANGVYHRIDNQFLRWNTSDETIDVMTFMGKNYKTGEPEFKLGQDSNSRNVDMFNRKKAIREEAEIYGMDLSQYAAIAITAEKGGTINFSGSSSNNNASKASSTRKKADRLTFDADNMEINNETTGESLPLTEDQVAYVQHMHALGKFGEIQMNPVKWDMEDKAEEFKALPKKLQVLTPVEDI